MKPHQTITGLFIAGKAGNNHIAPVYPYTHIPSRYKKRIAVMAELPTVIRIHTDPLAHGNLTCDSYITIAPFRMCTIYQSCLFEQDLNSLPRDLFSRRVAGLLLHCFVTCSLMW
jgi:hypothetical protein